MKKHGLILALTLVSFWSFSFAQRDSSRLRISILTCDPGNELYSLFGHTALRIQDSTRQTDWVYNYGTFDFNDPDFYSKFVKGKLDYFLSVEDLPSFLYEYQVTHRNVIEQVLLISEESKQAIKNALDSNLLGKNRYYKYDFLYDNCTTRIRDILEKHAGLTVNRQLASTGTSFRDMIHAYLDRGGMGWTKVGMDMLLGRPSDKKVTIQESLFLPDYLLKGIDSSSNLPSHKRMLDMQGYGGNNKPVNWPLWVLSLSAAMLLLVSYLRNKQAMRITRMADFSLLLATGLLGCLFLFTWFGTDHGAFAENYNLLWALPTQAIAAFYLWRKPKWLSLYFLACSIVYGGLLAAWFWLPQHLNPALIPLTLLLFIRSVRLSKKP